MEPLRTAPEVAGDHARHAGARAGVLGLLVGVVSVGIEDGREAASPGPFIAFGLALIPFVFVVLAFTSGHPRAPGAVVRAMGLTLLVGIPVSALAATR